MSSVLQFLKEWTPTLAVLIGGLWMLFKWLFDEKLRAKREVPSLDGKLTVTSFPLGKKNKIVSIEALWVNHSPFPIYMDVERCEIKIYLISESHLSLNQGIILKEDLGQPICASIFLKKLIEKDYFFEPKSESLIVNHFVLEPGIYGIRMVLHGLNEGELWWKEKIVDISHNL
jgi:hypothetical protein